MLLTTLLFVSARAGVPLEQPSTSVSVPLESAASESVRYVQVEITLVGGQTLSGLVEANDFAVWSAGSPLTLTLPGGSDMSLSGETIKSVEALTPREPGDFSYENPAASRYLYAPSAIPLRQGEGYISQKELIFTSLAYGLTDNLTVLVGAPVPVNLMLITENGFGNGLLIGGIKASGQLAPNLHIGGGLEAFNVMNETLGIGFVNGTVGDRDSNLTVGLGVPMDMRTGVVDRSRFIAVAGQHRINDKVSLISENWWLRPPDTGWLENIGLFSGGVRLVREDITVDLALMAAGADGEGMFLPLPWVDFAWHFGG